MLKTLIKARGSSACFLFYNLTAKSYFMNKSSFFTTGIFERINAITKLDTKATATSIARDKPLPKPRSIIKDEISFIIGL